MKFGLAALAFVVLATLNSGGYRYGASDQAFYQPAVLKQLDPSLFPRDTRVLAAQTRLTAADEVLAAVVRIARVPVPTAFALLYVVSLLVFAAGAWTIGSHLYAHAWTTVALIAALTLRHAIARSGTNTLEGYFHPRTAGVRARRRRRRGVSQRTDAARARRRRRRGRRASDDCALVRGVARRRQPPSRRPPRGDGVVARRRRAAVAGLWALHAGPARRTAGGDGSGMARRCWPSKDYLFPLEWPALCLAHQPGLSAAHPVDPPGARRAGPVRPRERALVLGLFVAGRSCSRLRSCCTRSASRSRFQLQPARVFWMFDFVAVDLCGLGARGGPPAARRPRARLAAAALLARRRCRAASTCVVEARRPPVQVTIPANDWGHVMAFARTTDTSCRLARRSDARRELRHQRARGGRTGCLRRGGQGRGARDVRP